MNSSRGRGRRHLGGGTKMHNLHKKFVYKLNTEINTYMLEMILDMG